jgi:hypothetical protein
MKPVVYLSGPITGLTYGDSTGWRSKTAMDLAFAGIKTSSPMRGKAFLDTGKELSALGDTGHGIASPLGITARDRFDTINAKCLLVNLLGAKRVSIGTMIELGWADMARVPIVIVMEPDNIHQHCIVQAVAGYIVGTLGEGVEMVTWLLKPYVE